jgi:NADH-quinone oxidoreductase subunit B
VASVQPVKFILNWGRRYSRWLLNFGLACCGIELIAGAMSKHDLIRFGVIPVAHGPREADLLIVAGTVTDKMAPVLRRVYEQMPEPKYVVSFGSCSNCGGPYWDSYSVTKGSIRSSRSTCSFPGCPPRPEALLDGIMMLQRKIAEEEIAEKWAG